MWPLLEDERKAPPARREKETEPEGIGDARMILACPPNATDSQPSAENLSAGIQSKDLDRILWHRLKRGRGETHKKEKCQPGQRRRG